MTRQTICLLAGLVLPLAFAAPATAQSVQAIAKANCMQAINARVGGSARFIKVSGGRTPIVKASAPGGVSFRCMCDAKGKPVRVRRDSANF